MEKLPLILITVSALGHAYWNYLLKKIINKSQHRLSVFWLCTLIGCILFLPVFIYYLLESNISLKILVYPALFGFFLAIYTLFLTKSYSYNDLSLAYPLAKITPLFTLFFGLIILGERISTLAFFGIFFVIFGAYSIHLKNFSLKGFVKSLASLKNKGSIFALCTAVASAVYGLVSKVSLSTLNPALFVYLGYLFSLFFYSFIFLFDKELWGNIRIQFRKYKKEILAIGFLDIFGYFLVLNALIGNKLSYVFALRQMSIIFAVLLGSKILKEECGKMRIASAIIILIGVILISLTQ